MNTKRHEGRNEAILEPDLPIIDSHIHLFDLPNNKYMVEDYLQDAQGGHNVLAAIYCETQTFARTSGPDHMKPLGEVEFANGVAAMTSTGRYGKCVVGAGIIGHANLTFGAKIGELLDRCMEAAPDRYRGIRHVTLDYPDERPYQFIMTYRPPAGILDNPNVPLALAELQKRGLSYDAAVYDYGLPRLTEVIDEFPDLTVVLNHIGNFVGVDMDATERAEKFAELRKNIFAIATRPNVHCKVGGLGMPQLGFGFEKRADELGYEELADAFRPHVELAIEAFGPERCMIESNFPPDGRSGGFIPTLNAYKHILKDLSESEKRDVFARNAAKVYRLDIDGI
jgi:L-fuconolactonase